MRLPFLLPKAVIPEARPLWSSAMSKHRLVELQVKSQSYKHDRFRTKPGWHQLEIGNDRSRGAEGTGWVYRNSPLGSEPWNAPSLVNAKRKTARPRKKNHMIGNDGDRKPEASSTRHRSRALAGITPSPTGASPALRFGSEDHHIPSSPSP